MSRRWRPWALWAVAAYTALVGAVLLSPISPGGIVGALTGWLHDSAGLPWVRQGWIEFGANIALFIPMGYLLTALWRRPWIGVVVGVLVSIAAELAQLALPARLASPRDVVANVLGALIGSLLAWAVLTWRAPPRMSRP